MSQYNNRPAKSLTMGSDEVIAYVQMLQGIINRMGANSANCKYMAIAAVAAMITLGTIGWPLFIFGSFMVIILFIIDSMYLGLEKDIIRQQNTFVDSVKNGTEKGEGLYKLASTNNRNFEILYNGMKSWSTVGFYVSLWIACIIYICTMNNAWNIMDWI